MQVPLREGDADARVGEGLVDGPIQRRDGADARIDGVDEGAQCQGQRVVAEGVEGHHRRRLVEDMLVRVCDARHDRRRRFHIAAVGDTHHQHDASDGIRQLVKVVTA